jgi:predicted  nucleic acid-binding Zn-ribbon protein
MKSTDLTIEILKGIRTELRELNGRVDETNGRLDQTNGRIDQTNCRLDEMREELSHRIVESELRTATALTDLSGSVRELTSLLRGQFDLRPRVEKCEEEIADIKRRLPAA